MYRNVFFRIPTKNVECIYQQSLLFLPKLFHKQRCSFRQDHKVYANAMNSKPVRHWYFIGLGVLSTIAGFSAGQLADFDEKAVPSPFILQDIENDLRKAFEFNPDVPAGIILFAYAHCISTLTGSFSEYEGCHNPDQTCMDIIESITKLHTIKHSDALTLAATQAIEFLGGPQIPWRYGRKKSNEQVKVTPLERTSSLGQTLSFFESLGFSTEECVALMACHGIGRARGSPLKLQWKERKYALDNEYFGNLIKNTYEKPAFDLRGFLFLRGENQSNIAALPLEVEMATSPVTKPIVQKFAKDTEQWRATFTTAFTKLIERPWQEKDLREYIALEKADKLRLVTEAKRQELESKAK